MLGLVVESLEAYTEVEEDKLKAGLRELESETWVCPFGGSSF